MAVPQRLRSAERRAAGYRFGALLPLLVAVLGLAALTAGQVVPNRHGMEQNLTERSARALAAAGLSSVEVSFTGRDGTLHAHTQAEADRAVPIVEALDGVRTAHAVVDPAPSEPAKPSTPATITLALAEGGWTLSGGVPSAAAKDALAAAAGASVGADHVTDHLSVDDTVSDAGVAGLADVLSAFGKQTTKAGIELRGGTLTVSGTVDDQATKDAVLAAAGKAVGAGHVVDQLAVQSVQQQLITIPPITFVTGSATLTPEGRQALVAAAAVLNSHPDVRVRIEGNTDSNGTAAANLVLSRNRALTVLETLVSLGVDRGRLEAVWFGESRPKVPDNSPANQAINRRVDFVVLT